MHCSNRMQALGASIFAELTDHRRALEANGVQTIDLSIGSPNIPPAPHIRAVIERETAKPENYVYAIKDTHALEQAAAAWYKTRYGVTLCPDTEVTSLLGSQDGLSHIALTIVDPGDAVLAPDPCYPIFKTGAQLAGGMVCPMPQKRENGYIIDLEAIGEDVARRAKLMIVSYPNNPTTAMAPPSFYEELVAFAQKYGIVVVHDNAYSDLVFDGKKGGSFLSYPGAKEIGIEFNSLSKNYGMAGCRIGFALGNQEIIGRLKSLKSNIDYGLFLPLQKAAIAAITGPYDCVRETAKAYETRRDVLCACFGEIGWNVEKPPATMFCWAQLPKGYEDSRAFALELMQKTGVIVTPGAAFGYEGEGHVRIALVQDEPAIREAAERIARSRMIDG
ncbi:MAG: aminotransferase class I/II-fold pyridoxal phosphate-dependent enzyme [Bacillota bacterium]